MAFVATDRVKVSDQSSQHRNHFGTVTAVLAGDQYDVRLDGYAQAGVTVFNEDELITSTQASPITYA